MTTDFNCGIYQIRNVETGRCYVGQSIHLKQREYCHWDDLDNKRYKNRHLQNSYNKHGKRFFIFEILMYCNPEDLTYYEQLFVDIDKTHNRSYNVRVCVESNRGIKRTKKQKEKLAKVRWTERRKSEWSKHMHLKQKKAVKERCLPVPAYITTGEIKMIRAIKNYKLEKICVVMLIMARSNKIARGDTSSHYYVYQDFSEICRIAKVRANKEERIKIQKELFDLGVINWFE